jgi:hypothetical protein
MRRRSKRFGSVQLGMKWLRLVCVLAGVVWVGQGFVWAQAPARVDKDPIASPDPDLPAGAANTTGGQTPQSQIEKERGRYTLRTDAYEVR